MKRSILSLVLPLTLLIAVLAPAPAAEMAWACPRTRSALSNAARAT